jgi:hypothetical protein
MNDLHPELLLYRTRLRAAVAADLRRRRTSRWAIRLGAPALAVGAAVAAAVVLLAGGTTVSSADAAVLHRVVGALTAPTGTLLHERALVTLAGQTPATYELWQDSNSPYAYRVLKFGHEAAWNGTEFVTYDAGSNSLYVQPGDAGARGPDDAAAQLRSLVAAGNATIAEQTIFHGVPAYKLIVSGAQANYLNGTVYVARADYRPLEIRTTAQTGPSGAPIAETIDYQTYEYVPSTVASRAELDIAAQHPGARTVPLAPDVTGTTSK